MKRGIKYICFHVCKLSLITLYYLTIYCQFYFSIFNTFCNFIWFFYSITMKNLFHDFIAFVYKQAYACIFWGFLIVMMTLMNYYYPLEDILYRYDFLFIIALAFQALLLMMRLESMREASVILIFHLVAMVMEVFKTHPAIGSWAYPDPFHIGIIGVPLFAGFMYSAVGSYIARVWRIFDFRFTQYPKRIHTIIIALGIYINFFTHHFIYDIRYLLLVAVLATFGRTTIYYTPRVRTYSMNLAFWFSLVALFIWIAENIATYTRVWIYPSQEIVWHPVWLEKILAWFLLMIISFVLVSLIHKPEEKTILSLNS